MGATREDVLSQLRRLSEQQGGQGASRPERSRGTGAGNQRNEGDGESTFQPIYNAAADFNTGVANLVGAFGTLDELFQSSLGVDNPDSYLPSISDVRTAGSEIGATRAPGVEADTVGGRFLEEAGAGAVPFIGLAARSGLPLLRLAGAELTSAAGATAGGIIGENSAAFQNDPQMGRLVGELFGGLSAVSLVDYTAKAGKAVPMGGFKIGKMIVDKAVDTARGRGSQRRAARRSQDVALSPETAAARIDQPTDVDIEAGITTPATMTGDPGVNRLTSAVMDTNPESAEELARAFSEEAQRLRGVALGKGNPDRVREFLELRLRESAAKLDASFKRLGPNATPAELSTAARGNLETAYSQSRAAERRMWNNVPSSAVAENVSAREAWAGILQDTTTQTGRERLPSVLKTEFGMPDKNTGKLTGGSLPENPTAKQLHELYSELGDMVRSEADKPGGSAKTIRYLTDIRKTLMDDLMQIDGGDEYRKAVNVSRQLNDRFTKGTVGDILGFSTRGRGTNTTETLDVMLKARGERATNTIRDLMKASPQVEGQLKDFMRDIFVKKTVDVRNNTINTDKAKRFLQDYNSVLGEFPDVRQEFARAMDDQRVVDDMVGRSSVSDLSLYQREKTGAGIFLESSPGREADAILNTKKGRATRIRELIDAVNEDPSGDAIEGLRTGFVETMFSRAGNSNILDEFTQGQFMNGVKLKSIIDDVENDLVTSGLFTKEEMGRLRIVSDRLGNIQRAMSARPSKEGVISDIPNTVLSLIARIGGAQIGRALAARTGGGTVQTPGIISGRLQKVVEAMTNDEAQNILIRAVKDKDVMSDLLKRTDTMSSDEQVSLVESLTRPIRSTAEIMPSIVARPAATAGQREETQAERDRVIEQLRSLQGGM